MRYDGHSSYSTPGEAAVLLFTGTQTLCLIFCATCRLPTSTLEVWSCMTSPMYRCFVASCTLVAVIPLAQSRYVNRLAAFQHAGHVYFCLDALRQPALQGSAPDLRTTDQGAQFTWPMPSLPSNVRKPTFRSACDGRSRALVATIKFCERLSCAASNTRTSVSQPV